MCDVFVGGFFWVCVCVLLELGFCWVFVVFVCCFFVVLFLWIGDWCCLGLVVFVGWFLFVVVWGGLVWGCVYFCG